MTRTISGILVLASATLFACDESTDVALAVGAQASTVNETPLVIDDFTTGLASLSLVDGHPPAQLQVGSMLGGTREIDFSVDADELQQPSSYTINEAGGLVISSGLRSYWGMYLVWGYDTNRNIGSFDLDLHPYDMVCLDFASNDQGVSAGVQFYKDGAWTTAFPYIGESSVPFSVMVPYSDFTSTTGESLPWDGVHLIVVLLQVGSPNAGNDLALESLTLGACKHPVLPQSAAQVSAAIGSPWRT